MISILFQINFDIILRTLKGKTLKVYCLTEHIFTNNLFANNTEDRNNIPERRNLNYGTGTGTV